MALFRRQGYEATGVAQILTEAGVNSGSLYYFFPRKEDLLLAVLERYKELLWPVVLQPAFDRVTDPLERVFAVLAGYRAMLVETGCVAGCPIAALALEMGDKSDEVRRLAAENFEAWRLGIRGCLEAAAVRFPRGTDLDRLATFVLTVMEGGVMQAKTVRSVAPFDACVDQLRVFIDLLTGKNGGSVRRRNES